MRITKKIAERLELRDDATPYGGKSYSDEKLDNFMAECEIPFGSSLKKVNAALVECGNEPFSVREVLAVAKTIGKRKMTSAQLNAVTSKARALRDKAYIMTLNAIKTALSEHGGRVSLLPPCDILKDLVDGDELVTIYFCNDHDKFYYLHGLQLDKEGRLEFLVVDPVERVTLTLQNQCLDYDIITVADVLQFELEKIEYDEVIDKQLTEC